jgi:WD40-like Beta Propeller Repeat
MEGNQIHPTGVEGICAIDPCNDLLAACACACGSSPDSSSEQGSGRPELAVGTNPISLYVVNDGKLEEKRSGIRPAWSPDGTRMAYGGDYDGNVWVDDRSYSVGDITGGQLVWTPDGQSGFRENTPQTGWSAHLRAFGPRRAATMRVAPFLCTEFAPSLPSTASPRNPSGQLVAAGRVLLFSVPRRTVARPLAGGRPGSLGVANRR